MSEKPKDKQQSRSADNKRYSVDMRVPSEKQQSVDVKLLTDMRQSQSTPNVGKPRSVSESNLNMRRLYSLSLSRIKSNSVFSDCHFKSSPYNIRWIYGFNHKAGVINVNKQASTMVFYAASNCGILYNWTANQMRILQGHRHMVTCIAADQQGKWLVTADSGSENIIIIWDNDDFYPQRTIFSPHGNSKLSKVALSGDAKYLLTLAYSKDKATLHWWIWSTGLEMPHVKIDADLTKDSVISMLFNPDNSEQFVLLTKSDLHIGVSGKIFVMERGVLTETDEYQIKLYKPEKKLSPELGRLSCVCFVAVTKQILVPTSRGGVLVYGYTLHFEPRAEDNVSANVENLKFIKVLKVEKCRINTIRSIDGVIVTGNSAGEIHFYDNHMKLLYWVHGFTVDCVKDISFNISPRSYKIFDPKCKKLCPCWEKVVMHKDPVTNTITQKLVKMELPTDATIACKTFIVRDFVICTQNQGIGFVDFVTEKLNIFLDYKISNALSLTVHPEKPLACIGYTDGLLELITIDTHKLFKRVDLRETYKVVIPPKDDSIKCNYEITIPQLSVTCLKYAPSGVHLACGLNTGQIIFLDPATIDILVPTPFTDTKHAIKEFDFSLDSQTMACSDTGNTVLVYKYDCDTFKWSFVGKHRAHYKEITSVFFLPKKNEDGEWKLISLGADRIMVEYDIGNSSDEYLEILSLDRVDQTAVPLGGIVWPTPKFILANPEENRGDMPLLLVANDEHKYKIVNYSTTMTLATVLGPRFETPVRKMKLAYRKEKEEELTYLVFATKNVIGLQRMPLDGNPWKHAGVLGHPNQILVMCYRHNIGTLFTIGSKDSCMCQWAANYRTVDTTTRLGGSELDPYYCLIENGRPGWLFREIRDLFYYIQILCQGTFSPAMRRVKDYIPIDSLPDLMRALGYFPSDYEVENLLVEAKYKVYQWQPSTEIDFEEFVKLYVNHRPAFGYNIKKVRNAYRTFASYKREQYTLTQKKFLGMLSDYGERFSSELSWYLLSILAGHSFEERAQMTPGDFSFLPSVIKFTDLVSNIIGLRDFDNVDQQSFMTVASPNSASSLDSEDKTETLFKYNK